MAENSKIEWTDHTFNGWVGCTKVSAACDGCYAESWAKRTGQPQLWSGDRRRTTPDNWQKPIKWNKAAEAAGKRARVFCCSLADVFDNQVPPEWRFDLFALIRATPHLEWQLLTKRPQNIIKMCQAAGGLPANAALGTTAEDQEQAAIRIPRLLAAKRELKPLYAFASIEPLLGPVDLMGIVRWPGCEDITDALQGFIGHNAGPDGEGRVMWEGAFPCPKLDWVIVGGESGPKARPMHPGWARALRDQCGLNGTPFFFKQWGEWLPGENLLLQRPAEPARWQDGQIGRHSLSRENGGPRWQHYEPTGPGTPGAFGLKVGKAKAGRLLDGREWSELPRVAA